MWAKLGFSSSTSTSQRWHHASITLSNAACPVLWCRMPTETTSTNANLSKPSPPQRHAHHVDLGDYKTTSRKTHPHSSSCYADTASRVWPPGPHRPHDCIPPTHTPPGRLFEHVIDPCDHHPLIHPGIVLVLLVVGCWVSGEFRLGILTIRFPLTNNH